MANKPAAVRLLREEVRHLLSSRRYAKALEAFGKLEALEPAEPEWPRRAAECHAALKKPKEQAEALARAAEGFDKARIANKADALCRLSLAVDPRNARARRLLVELDRLRPQTWALGSQQAAEASPTAPHQAASLPTATRLELALRRRRATALKPS
jgi:tetratricopeptide (TPR) repeat protein